MSREIFHLFVWPQISRYVLFFLSYSGFCFPFQSCKHMFLMDCRKTFPHYGSSFDVNVFDTRNCHHLTSNGKDDSSMYFDVQVSTLLW